MKVARVLVAQILFLCIIFITSDNIKGLGHTRRLRNSNLESPIAQHLKNATYPLPAGDHWKPWADLPSVLHGNGTITYNRCPAGFINYSGIENSRNIVMCNSNCAMPCRSPIWTSSEWNILSDIASITSGIGAVISIISVFSRLTHPKYCFQNSTLILVISSAILSVTNFIVSFMDNSNKCMSSTEPIRSNDGPTSCAAQSVIMLYALLVGCLAWTVQGINLLFKFVYDVDLSKKLEITYFIVTLGLPLIPVAIVLSTGSYGFSGIFPWCSPTDIDFRIIDRIKDANDGFLLYLPGFIIVLLGVIVLLPIGWTVVSTVSESIRIDSEKSAKSSRSGTSVGGSSKQVVPYSSSDDDLDTSPFTISMPSLLTGPLCQIITTPLVFCVPFLLLWITLVGLRWQLYIISSDEHHRSRIVDWWHCIERHYDGVNDQSWLGHCPAAPDIGISFPAIAWVTACFYGQSIFVCIIHPPILKLTYMYKLLQVSVNSSPSRKKPPVLEKAKRIDMASLGFALTAGRVAGISIGAPSQRDRGMTSHRGGDDGRFEEDFECSESELSRSNRVIPVENNSTRISSRRVFGMFLGPSAPAAPVQTYELMSAKHIDVSRSSVGQQQPQQMQYGHEVAAQGSAHSSEFVVRQGSKDEDKSDHITPVVQIHSMQVSIQGQGQGASVSNIRLESNGKRPLSVKRSGKATVVAVNPKDKEKIHSEFEQQSEADDLVDSLGSPKKIMEESAFRDYLESTDEYPMVTETGFPVFRVPSSEASINSERDRIVGSRMFVPMSRGSSSIGPASSISSHPSSDLNRLSRDESEGVQAQLVVGASNKSEMFRRNESAGWN